MNKAITFAILVLFLVQVSVAAVSSCSTMMMSSALSSQKTNDNAHQMMDHSQHALMFSSADNIGDSSKVNHSLHENMHENMQEYMQDDCCDESCICEIASCSYSNLMNHSTGFIFTNQTQQTKILFIASAHQAQYLNYLFKPPIRSIA